MKIENQKEIDDLEKTSKIDALNHKLSQVQKEKEELAQRLRSLEEFIKNDVREESF